MAESPSVRIREQNRLKTLQTFRTRLQYAFGIALTGLVGFLILGFFLYGPETPLNYLTLLSETFLLTVMLWYVARAGSVSELAACGVALMAIVYTGTAIACTLAGDEDTMALTFGAVSVGAAAMLPWGPRTQLLAVVMGLIAVSLNLLLIDVPLIDALSAAEFMAIGMTGAGSVYIAGLLERQREVVLADAIEIGEAHASLEQRVAERTAELETVTRDLQTFSYSISHDLRASLRSIGGFSQALMDDFGERLGPEAVDWLGRMQAASARVDTLIDDLLTLVRATRGQCRPVPVDLTSLAHEVEDELRSEEPDRAVTVEIAPDMHDIGDPGLLRVAWRNLIGNAWKYTRNRSAARIEVATTEREGRHVYFVRDNGIGFDQKDAEKVFEPFARLHSATAFEGTGIGLATVQRIIERHGGRTWAEGEPDRGATIYFTLLTETSEVAA